MFFRTDHLKPILTNVHQSLEASIKNSESKLDDATLNTIKRVIERVVCLHPENGIKLAAQLNLKMPEFLQALHDHHQQALKLYFSTLLNKACIFESSNKESMKNSIQQSLSGLNELQCEYLYYAGHVPKEVAGLRNYECSLIDDKTYQEMVKGANTTDENLRKALGSYGLCNVFEKHPDLTKKASIVLAH